MKRGKDGEKIMEPMFPRLHVKDTEKGGPRAPPRNKMALYEQLSIPSHRFSHVALPGNAKNSAANSVPPMSQVGEKERSMFAYGQQPPRHSSDQQHGQYSDLSTLSVRVEKRKKLDDDDYTVPVFDNSTSCQNCDKYSNNMNREILSPSDTHCSSHSQKAKEAGMIEHGIRQENENQKENHSQEFLAGWAKSISNSSSIGKSEGPKKQNELGDKPRNTIERLKAHDSLLRDFCADSQPSNDGPVIAKANTGAVARRNSSNSKKGLPSEDHNIALDSSDDSEYNELEMADSVSETSILDTVSLVEITPDDVAGVLGQKHFWKARRAISNQQRVFAVQVFELHRLIKVQKLIAASPHLLLEDSPYLGKPIKALPIKKTVVKPIPHPSKQKDELEKPKDSKKEGSAKSTAENPSFSSAQNPALPANCRPEESSVTGGDQNTKPWCYNQPAQGHQWLVPVMSPSEGLIYKLYPGPGFPGQAWGGCGPPGSIPMIGNFFTPAYGIPAAAQYQPHSYRHGYFPPYSMPTMNTAGFSGSSVEQTSQRNGTVADNVNSHVSKDIEVQASSTSSPNERVQGSSAVDSRNVLPLFTSSGQVLPERPGGVIRVVPHNAMSASESAARIFRAIQEGRKQHDSV